MLIETTICIRNNLSQRLARTAVLTGYSKRSIISILLRRFAEDNNSTPVTGTRIKYQKRFASDDGWRRMHVLLSPVEYEFFIDLRKVFKKSVSACVAEAIDRYLDDLIQTATKHIDNYRFTNYSFSRIVINNIICWVFAWGVPGRIMLQTSRDLIL